MRTVEYTPTEWDRLAAGYDRNVTPRHMDLASHSLQFAGLEPGMLFLDVAAGTGALSIPAARLGARVLATDLSGPMLALLKARALQAGLDLEVRVMDGHALQLTDDTFDVAGSQFGVMLFPGMPQGIREMTRVVKPGGRVLMTVFGDPRHVEFFAAFMRAIRSVRPQFTGPPEPPLPFQLQDPERLRQELSAAGLTDVRIETVTESMEFTSGEEFWESLVNSNPIVETVFAGLAVTAAERKAIRQHLVDFIPQRMGSGAACILTHPINIGIGTK